MFTFALQHHVSHVQLPEASEAAAVLLRLVLGPRRPAAEQQQKGHAGQQRGHVHGDGPGADMSADEGSRAPLPPPVRADCEAVRLQRDTARCAPSSSFYLLPCRRYRLPITAHPTT